MWGILALVAPGMPDSSPEVRRRVVLICSGQARNLRRALASGRNFGLCPVAKDSQEVEGWLIGTRRALSHCPTASAHGGSMERNLRHIGETSAHAGLCLRPEESGGVATQTAPRRLKWTSRTPHGLRLRSVARVLQWTIHHRQQTPRGGEYRARLSLPPCLSQHNL